MDYGLDIWTVYDHPNDYPNNYVARRFVVTAGEPSPTDDILVVLDVESIRTAMRARGMVCLPRKKEDAPQIMECWI